MAGLSITETETTAASVATVDGEREVWLEAFGTANKVDGLEYQRLKHAPVAESEYDKAITIWL